VLSPRLELGISRVSGGRINQLSHESASSFRSLAKTGLLLILSQPDPHVRSSPLWRPRTGFHHSLARVAKLDVTAMRCNASTAQHNAPGRHCSYWPYGWSHSTQRGAAGTHHDRHPRERANSWQPGPLACCRGTARQTGPCALHITAFTLLLVAGSACCCLVRCVAAIRPPAMTDQHINPAHSALKDYLAHLLPLV